MKPIIESVSVYHTGYSGATIRYSKGVHHTEKTKQNVDNPPGIEAETAAVMKAANDFIAFIEKAESATLNA